MFLTFLTNILLLFVIIDARRVIVGKLPCDVQIADAQLPAYIKPLVVTAYDLNKYVAFLRMCNIEQAQIGGWNDHIGTYTLTWNGNVTPSQQINLPAVGLFIESCDCDILKIVCATDMKNLNGAECPVNAQNAPCPATQCPTPCSEERPVICNDMPECKPECISPTFTEEKCPETPAKEEQSPCEKEESCEDSKDDLRGKIFVSQHCTFSKTECGKKKELVKCSKDYTFSMNRCRKPVLKAVSRQHKRKEEIIDLCREDIDLNPSLLNEPKLLLKIQRKIERRLCKKACIYITSDSRIFAAVQKQMYEALRTKHGFKLRKVSSDELGQLITMGLFRVRFE